jgi:uncharacterized metal-binding protein
MLQKFGMLDNNAIFLTCSGASNVGQMSHQAVVELSQEGFGKFFCLAGIGAHLDKFVQSAKTNPEVVVIDGCPVGCAKRIVEHAEVPISKYLVVTKLGLEKNHVLKTKEDEIEKVKLAVRNLYQER